MSEEADVEKIAGKIGAPALEVDRHGYDKATQCPRVAMIMTRLSDLLNAQARARAIWRSWTIAIHQIIIPTCHGVWRDSVAPSSPASVFGVGLDLGMSITIEWRMGGRGVWIGCPAAEVNMKQLVFSKCYRDSSSLLDTSAERCTNEYGQRVPGARRGWQ